MESIPPVVDVLFPPPPPPPLDKDGEFDGNVERSVRELWWYVERCALTTTDEMLFEADVKLLRLFKLLVLRLEFPTTTFSKDSVRRGEEYMSLGFKEKIRICFGTYVN